MSLVSFDSSPLGPEELAIRIAARLSGLAVSVSGVVINLQSGDIVVAEISGAQVQISGQVVKISGETLISRISGEVVRISGETLISKISGETLISRISGQVTKISGEAVQVSGEVVKISGEAVQVSGEVVKISGEVVQNQIATQGRVRALLGIQDISGGTILLSGDINAMTLVNLSGNANMFVGFATAGEMPRSGVGILVPGGASVNLGINNFNRIRVFAQTSGEVVSYFGTAF